MYHTPTPTDDKSERGPVGAPSPIIFFAPPEVVYAADAGHGHQRNHEQRAREA